jgi:hypothetical protein
MNEPDKIPTKITVIGTLMVISGILLILNSIGTAIVLFIIGTLLLPLFGIGIIFYIIMIGYLIFIIGGVLDLVNGIKTLQGNISGKLPIWSPIMEIVLGFLLISSFIGMVILGIGIANLILMLQSDSREYFEGGMKKKEKEGPLAKVEKEKEPVSETGPVEEEIKEETPKEGEPEEEIPEENNKKGRKPGEKKISEEKKTVPGKKKKED